MYNDSYIDTVFAQYINRYCTGIVLFKDTLQKVSMSYYLSDAFSNYACRFSLSIDFIDFTSLTNEEKLKANKCFYNSSNNSGSDFVSFIYKRQRDYEIDETEIKSFIFHYQFAQELFEGFIKNILPQTCILEIESLNDEPFFSYIRDYFQHKKYEERPKRAFEKEYQHMTKSRFEFDCYYHNTLLKHSEKSDVRRRDDTITDKELFEAGGCSIEDIRRFVVDNKVKFYTGYNESIIREIEINKSDLREKIKDYKPDSQFVNIKPANILKLLDEREKHRNKKEAILKQKKEETGIEEGGYIYIQKNEWGKEVKEFGLVKEIKFDYNDEISIQYNKLNKDLLQSRLPLKDAKVSEVFFIIKPDIFIDELSKAPIKSLLQTINLFIDKGTKNKLFLAKKIKSK